MVIYPAIDIKGGSCVRLTQGLADQETEYYADPVEPARMFKEAGSEWVHVVDLDGAFSGALTNLKAVERIVSLGLKVQFGGGVRELSNIEELLSAGISRVVVGTRACQDRDFVVDMVERFGDQVAVGIDARHGKVAVRGWVDVTDMDAFTLARSVAEVGVKTIIYTDISTDGMMTGPNFEGQKQMCQTAHCNIIASGGVADLHDVIHYADLSHRFPNLHGVIVGKALYEKKFTVEEALNVAGR